MDYRIDWSCMNTYEWAIISFKKANYIFSKDVYEIICNCFNKFNLNRIEWSCVADNPAIKMYRKFIKNHGGKECGYFRQMVKLQDGKIHDMVKFEILAEEFH